jgi:hypothetical protein
LRHRLLKESYSDCNFNGCIWSLNDLWEYYYEFQQIMEKYQNVKLPQEHSGIDISHVEQEKGQDKSQETIEQEIDDFLDVYPEEGFPNLKTIFGLDPQKKNINNINAALERAFNLISLITAYCTDLNSIDKEKVIQEYALFRKIYYIRRGTYWRQ